VKHVLVLAEEGYTANIPLEDLQRRNVLFAFDHDGVPLTAEHGGPVRLIVPHLYAWKSVKWVRGFMLLDEDRLGFWERNGYPRLWRPLERAALLRRLTRVPAIDKNALWPSHLWNGPVRQRP